MIVILVCNLLTPCDVNSLFKAIVLITNPMEGGEGEVVIAVVERDQVEVMEQQVCGMVLIFDTVCPYDSILSFSLV